MDAPEVVVEAHLANGLPAFTLVGFVIELPILWLAFDTPRKPKRVLAAIALANAATALALVCWYGAASDVSLASRFDSVKEPAMVGLDGTREAVTDEGQSGALPWVWYEENSTRPQPRSSSSRKS